MSEVTLVDDAVPHTYSTVGWLTSRTKQVKPERDWPFLRTPEARVIVVSVFVIPDARYESNRAGVFGTAAPSSVGITWGYSIV